MKKIILFLSLALMVGGCISLYFYNILKDEINVKVISVFQTGVYSNFDEALASSDSKSKVFYDGKLYHVYDAITSNDDAKVLMMKYYNEKNIKYYIKNKYVSKSLYDDINKYSEILKLSDKDTLKIINKQVIEKFGDQVI